MGNLHFYRVLRNCILCATAVTIFSGSICTPYLVALQSESTKNIKINLNEIAFIARLEKLYERVKRYKDKFESGKLMEVMFEIKTEVEGYRGKKIDLDAYIDIN
jgi:hypothetical protein